MIMYRFLPLLWLIIFIAQPTTARGEDRLGRLDLFRLGYPRAFFFRMTEGFARTGKLPFEEWDKTFARLNGIMGKALDEEVPNTSAGCIPYFTRFKGLHPGQAVLLHFNGNSRDPRFDTGEFFAGHWIYFNGCRLTKDLPAEGGESTISVEEPALFLTAMGRYGDKNEDLGICTLGPGGRPNWAVSEQLELLGVDQKSRTLRVRRGAFGTKPLVFEAGKAYIAAHVSEGPWGRKSNLLWYYNFSPACPRDPKGRACADVLVSDLAKHFSRGGDLAAFDGIEFDVLGFGHITSPGGTRGWDIDADGKPDWGFVNGTNVYGIGVCDFCRKLRGKLGDDFLIMADGQSPSSQRAFGLLNGIESEGWPHLSDHKVEDWSGGLNRHFYWRDHARKPVFNYVNHKFVEAVPGKRGEHRGVETPFSISRLVFAACMFTDSAITYSLPCPAEPDEKFGVYDELRRGVENRTNWLGRPLGPPVRLALRSLDLLKGEGARPTQEFLGHWGSGEANIALSPLGGAIKISAKSPEARTLRCLIDDVNVPAGDLFVHFTARGDAMAGYPAEIPRLMWVGIRREQDVMEPHPAQTGMALRGGKETAITPESGAMVRDLAAITIAGEAHGGYFIHPPWRQAVGYVYWQAEVRVPEQEPVLSFYTGLSDRPPSRSDGIAFKIWVRERDKETEVFNEHHAERVWKRHSVDMSPWKGERVTLRFIADCGPKDNSTADQGAWAEVCFGGPGGPSRPPKAWRYMAWIGGQDTDVGFYFRDPGPATVRVSFEIEGTEPVCISGLTLHAHPDAMAREFENGVVLANPSDRDYTFDLKELFPQRKLRRLKGSPRQDPATNNGQEVVDKATLGPRDGLFLVAE